MVVFRALQAVFQKVSYVITALFVSVLSYVFVIWLPNLGTVFGILFSSESTISFKFHFSFGLLGGILTNYTPFSAVMLIMIVILFGMDVAMIIFYLRRKIGGLRKGSTATSFLGVFFAVFGAGCAACGTFLFATLFTFIGAGAFIRALPLGGEEFGIVAILLLLFSIYLTSRQIMNPKVCQI